jgi:glycosyltransferase involved in cell wall biosynthesis
MFSIVVSTPDVVGSRMAGPGIRAYHIARELARYFPTSLIAEFEDFALADEQFTAIQRHTAEARWALLHANVVFGQPARELLALPRRDRKFVYDLFDPTVLELRELYGSKPTLRQSVHYNREWGRLRLALQQGDLLVSATRRQRDFYTGVFCSFAGGSGEWLERWLEIPFGIDEEGPQDGGIAPLDGSRPWIIWGGGTWEWLDPLTAVQAVRKLNSGGVECRLLFMGGPRPNRAVQAGTSAGLQQAISEAGDAVVRNTEWVPYGERWRWLRSGRLAVMLHRATLESEFSIRTRLFDAIWAGLPVVATEGGYAADLVRQEECGVVVRPSDPDSVASGMERLLTDNTFHAGAVSNLEHLRPRFSWTNVTRPLVEAISRWAGEEPISTSR